MTIFSRFSSGSHLTAAISAALLLLSSCAPAVAQTETAPLPSPSFLEEKGTIQVTGQAQLTVPADVARISLIVETEGSTAADATGENARRMDAVIRAIRGLGIDGLDIETFGFTLRPEYEVSRDGTGTRTISGYRVQNNIRVMLPDVDATGRVLDEAVGVGANRVANLQFQASDTRAARLEALGRAVRSAREQAEAIASAMGVALGQALEVQGGANAPDPFSMGGMMIRAQAETTTPVEAGDQMVTASVTIKYRILEGGL
jgi:uncharacterized protein YggE